MAAFDLDGVACDVIAPSLVPVRAGDRVKTDRRDAKKLATLYRAGLLRFCQPPTPEHEGLRDLLRCRDDIRCARTAARHRVVKQLGRHHRIYRDGKQAWTKTHIAWVRAQQLDDLLAQPTPAGSWSRRPGTTATPPGRPSRGPDPSPRAWQAQIRLNHRHRHLIAQGKRPTVVTVAVARELVAFLWAELTDQPTSQPQEALTA